MDSTRITDFLAETDTLLGIPHGTSERQIRQESAMDPRAVSPAGARGLAQVMPATLASLSKRMGKELDPHNPEHALVMHRELMRENLQKFGNLPDALRAYNAGWDKGRWNNPETVDYVQRVYRPGADGADLLPASIRSAPAPTPSPARAASLEALYEAAKGLRLPKALQPTAVAKAAAAATALAAAPVKAATPEDEWYARASVQDQQAVKDQAERDAFSGMDGPKAALMAGMTGDLIRRLARPEFTPDGTVAAEDELVGYTVEEQDYIREGASKAERDRIKFDFDDRKEAQRQAGLHGTGWALAYGALAEAPLAVATGMGATLGLAKLGMGSVALAGAGRTGAAAGSLVAENVGTGLALTAAQDYMTPFVHAEDYLIGSLGDTIGIAAGAPSVIRAARGVETDAMLSILNRAVEGKQAALAEARAKLGEDATPEAVAQEAGRIQVEQIKSTVHEARGSLGADRKLIPDDVNDVLMGEVPVKAEVGEATLDASGWGSVSTATERAKFESENPLDSVKFDPADRSRLFERDPTNLQIAAEGLTIPAMRQLPTGATVLPQLAATAVARPAVTAIKELVDKMLPGVRVVVGLADSVRLAKQASDQLKAKIGPDQVGGVMYTVGEGHVIGMNANGKSATDMLFTGTHEVGHVVLHQYLKDVPQDLLRRMAVEHGEFIREMRSGRATAALKRFREGSEQAIKADGTFAGRMRDSAYNASFDEYGAEAFVRWAQRRQRGDAPVLSDPGVASLFKAAWEGIKRLWEMALQKGYLSKDVAFDEFFDRVLNGSLKEVHGGYLDDSIQLPDLGSFDIGPAARTDADIIRDYGLDTLAGDSPAQAARLKAMVHLYRKAEAYPVPDAARLSKLMSAAPMKWAASTAHTLLSSANPVARMVAAELLEHGAGAAGRRSNAALAKWIHEQEFMGNAVNDLQRHYAAWRNANGGGLIEDHFGGTKWQEFNRRVALLMENRLAGRADAEAPAVIAAADVLEAGYERMRAAQQQLKTPGWGSLPATSFGYMPHRMSAGKLREASPAQRRVLHQVLTEQFQGIEGFDEAFSKSLASKYIDIVTKRGTAGYSAPIGVHSVEAADIVEQSAAAMGMSRDEANALAKRVLKAAPAHTRHRLQLDLTRQYDIDGQSFQLVDLFETDQLALLRSQASRVSGEAALVKHNIMGSTGLKLLREAMGDHGMAGAKATNAELEAFDQVAAEFLGQPFGKQNGKWLDRATLLNGIISLGGIGFNQAAETLNLATTLGVRHALASVSSARRLRAEIIALSKGQAVNNPIIGSLEVGGAEFGTGHYKLVFPFDNPHRPEVYGADTANAFDRLLRSGSHLQGKLSLWRAITAAQERGAAEQIVHKALRFINEGKISKNLADMGIDDALAQSIRNDLPNVAQFDAQGRLLAFDVTKLSDPDAANAFVQAVHRGSRQIIQGTFIGETGKWMHSDVLRMMVQFRTFSLVAVEKQWNRVAGNHGSAAALGILLGTATLSLPIIMIRAALASLGRPDQEEYLEKQLHPVMLARNTLNYVALSGLAGDLTDAVSAVGGLEATGGRSGSNKDFLGNVAAPALGRVNDMWGAIQNTKEGTDVSAAVRQMPFSRLPFLLPAVNALRPD